MYEFDQRHMVLVDEMGIMIQRVEVEDLVAQAAIHLSHSRLKLEAIGRRTVEFRHPSMVGQFNFDIFKD